MHTFGDRKGNQTLTVAAEERVKRVYSWEIRISVSGVLGLLVDL